MENQVEVLETSDVSNEEIDRMLQGFEETSSIVEESPYRGPLDDLQELLTATQERSAEIAGVPTQALESSLEEEKEEEKEEEPVLQPMEPIIPINSPTLLVEESSSRFSSAVWYAAVRTKSIVLAGVGGIGRFGNLKIYYYLCA